MKRRITITLASLAILALTLNAQAENYVNWGKGYYVSIPEDWRQIERFNVDNFLRFHGNDPTASPYDAFFCPVDATPFYSKAYVFVNAELMENSIALADSIRLVMEAEFDQMVNELADSSAVTKMKSRKPVYDSKGKTITMVSDMRTGDQDQTMMLIVKFYNQGIATFYCYTTSEMFDIYRPVFERIRDGFGDEDLDAAAEAEPVKMAKIENASGSSIDGDESSDDSDDSSGGAVWVPFIGLAIILVIIISRKRKTRKES